jgi:carbamoyl-phosphate synthase large subunit
MAPQNAPRSSRRTLRVLLSCIGRRVELAEAFRAAGRELGIRLELHGTDTSPLAPAIHHVDRAHLVKPVSHRRYIHDLIKLATRNHIDLIVPTIDTDLPKLADARDRFARLGCRVIVSSPEVIAIGRDKLLTHVFLTGAGIETPLTWPAQQVLRRRRRRFPCQIKPRYGSAGHGNYRVDDAEALGFWARRVPDPVVQEFVPGDEYTLDVYAGLDGRARCVVPRRRLEVRAGEVQKAQIVKDARLIGIGRRVVDAMGECVGVITVQVIREPSGRIRVIEINPRFGGGAPLSIRAGADFPRWLLAEHLGRRPRILMDGYRDGLYMLRYDQSVFVDS